MESINPSFTDNESGIQLLEKNPSGNKTMKTDSLPAAGAACSPSGNSCSFGCRPVALK